MARGVSKSIEEIKFLVERVEFFLNQPNYDISSACHMAGVSRKSYYHYQKKKVAYEVDKRKHPNQEFLLAGKTFLYEMAILCPLISTRSLHQLYNEIFVPLHNNKIHAYKNPKPSPFSWKKELDNYMQNLEFVPAQVESYWRVYNCLKEMGLEKMERHEVIDENGNLKMKNGRLEQSLAILKPLLEDEINSVYVSENGEVFESPKAEISKYIGDFENIIDVVSKKIKFQSNELPVHFVAWLKRYAVRNPKKTIQFMKRLYSIP